MTKEELKALAEAAMNDSGDYVALNAYGMAAHPSVIVTLITANERLEDALHCASTESQHGRDSSELRRLCQARDDARRERDQLKAEIESLTKRAEAAEQECKRCPACDGTADVHRIDGEWLGECNQCNANDLANAKRLNVELIAKLKAAELNARRQQFIIEQMTAHAERLLEVLLMPFRGIDAHIAQGGRK